MKRQKQFNKKTNAYLCSICEDLATDFQVCCGHPMMAIHDGQAIPVCPRDKNRQ